MYLLMVNVYLYSSLWVLDKCSKYLDGVIYNMELAIKEDE